VPLCDWLDQDPHELVEEFRRLYVPRRDARWLRRNALVAAGNVGSTELTASVARHARSDDEMLAETATWALARMAERGP
jgi:epoxyqueuosine reductase QueG